MLVVIANITTNITNATKITNFMDKRFKKTFLRTKTYFTNPLLKRLGGRKHRGVVQTKFTIYNWFYGRNENDLLEKEFYELLKEEEPECINESIFEEHLQEVA